MSTFLLDTSVIMDALNDKRGRAALLAELLSEGHLLACCPINVTEVYAGMRLREQAPTEAFLSSLQYVPISREAARLAGDLKRITLARGPLLI